MRTPIEVEDERLFMTGEVGILSVGAGDTRLSFDKGNPAERIRAARIVADMLKRGYALLVEVEPGKYERAKAFDEERCEYVIADFDPVAAQASDESERRRCTCPDGGVVLDCPVHGTEKAHGEGGAAQARADQPTAEATEQPRRRGRPPGKRLSAEQTRAIAVARTAGG